MVVHYGSVQFRKIMELGCEQAKGMRIAQQSFYFQKITEALKFFIIIEN